MVQTSNIIVFSCLFAFEISSRDYNPGLAFPWHLHFDFGHGSKMLSVAKRWHNSVGDPRAWIN